MANRKSLASNFQSLILRLCSGQVSNLQSLLARDTLAILFLIAFPFIYFWRVTLGQDVWFTRDISRLYHPFAVLLSRALQEGRLPFWVNELQTGFPLVAEGHVAAFYPPNLLLVKFLPPESALAYEMLLHLAWAACGMYLGVRGMGAHRTSALLAGFTFAFSGFMIQKLYHTPILLTAAWLPWLIFLQDQFQRAHKERQSRAGIWFLLTALAAGIQWLIGFPQIALLNSITCALFGFFGGLFWNSQGEPWRLRWRTIPRVIFWTALPLLLSGGIAALQLIPTAELIGYSARAQGLSEARLNEYPMPVDALAQFIAPFVLGEPSDDNIEFWGYFGITTLVWAVGALAMRRDARTFFYLAFTLFFLSLTVGAVNPVFQMLMHLPVFNFFRVPARYLLLVTFGATWLCATTAEILARRVVATTNHRVPVMITGIMALLTLGIISLADTQSLDFWFALWHVLVWVLGLLAAILVALAWTRRITRGSLAAWMIGLVVLDLSAYAAPFLSTTVARLTPPAYVDQVPRSVPVLDAARASGRVLTDETIWPSVPALRSSLYPNFGAVYGYEMAHIASPLVFDAIEKYVFNLSPAMLNVMNVRYFAIPLEPRYADRSPTPDATFALDVLDNPMMIPPTPAIALQVESFTDETADLDGTPVAEIQVTFDDSTTRIFPLRVGIETADWDLGRQSGDGAAPSRARVVRTVPAFMRSVGSYFDGYVYQARFDLAASQPRRVTGVMVRALVSRRHLAIEKISLLDAQGDATSLAALGGKNDLTLKYMSDTTAIWENVNVLPRAFLVHRAEVLDDAQTFNRLEQLDFRPDQIVLLQEGQALTVPEQVDVTRDRVELTRYQPSQVMLIVTTGAPAYLVLADAWYPGWSASVDGEPVTISRADFVFRAIPIAPGQHLVVFNFFPTSVLWGIGVSITTLLVTLAIAFRLGRSATRIPGGR